MCSAAAVPYFVSLSAHAAQEKPFGLLSNYALRGDSSPWNIPTFVITSVQEVIIPWEARRIRALIWLRVSDHVRMG